MDVKEAMKMAIDNEVKGREMYKKFAGRAENEVTKRTFQFLASEETRHIDSINSFDPSSAVVPMDPKGFGEIKTIFEESIEHFDKQAKPKTDDLEAHKIGMELERKSFELYEKLRDEAEDENIRKFFQFLIKEEKAHFELIQKSFNFISDPEGFYAEQEGRVMEG